MMRTGHVVPLLEWAGILKALPRLGPTRCLCKLQTPTISGEPDRQSTSLSPCRSTPIGDLPPLFCPRAITKTFEFKQARAFGDEKLANGTDHAVFAGSTIPGGLCLSVTSSHKSSINILTVLGMSNSAGSLRCVSMVSVAPFLLVWRMRIIIATSCLPGPSRFPQCQPCQDKRLTGVRNCSAIPRTSVVTVRQSATPSPRVSAISPPSSTFFVPIPILSLAPESRRLLGFVISLPSHPVRLPKSDCADLAGPRKPPGYNPVCCCVAVSPSPSRKGAQRLSLFRRRLTLRSTPRTVPNTNSAPPRATKRLHERLSDPSLLLHP